LEVAACRLAAENITEEGLDKLRLTLARHQDVKSDKISDLYSEWHDLDFHYQIALACGNRRLIDLLCGDIWCLLRLYRYPGILSPGRIPLGYVDHQSILEALVARDPDACEKVMRQHLAHSREVLLNSIKGSELVQTKTGRGASR
jgi:DNA-binding GntR family transcriptional regulator